MPPTMATFVPVLEPHDPSWRDRFAAAAAELNRFGNPDWVIEHIGSTAIPGLAAKPIIDLAVRVDDAADLDPGCRGVTDLAGPVVRVVHDARRLVRSYVVAVDDPLDRRPGYRACIGRPRAGYHSV